MQTKKVVRSDHDRIKGCISDIPNLYQGSFRRLLLKALQRKSMRAAIKSRCLECMDWKNAEVSRCNVVTCPLWRYRPGSKTRGKKELKVGVSAAKIEKELHNGG